MFTETIYIYIYIKIWKLIKSSISKIINLKKNWYKIKKKKKKIPNKNYSFLISPPFKKI